MLKKGEHTRRLIFDCAEKVFSEKGYFEAQVSDISEMAHIAKGTLYQYFKTKEHLFTSLIEKYVTEWERAVSLDLQDFMGTGDARDYARRYLHHRMARTIGFFSVNQDRANIVLRMSTGLNSVIEHVIRIFEDKVMKAITDDIRLAQNFGHISKNLNVELAGNAVLGGVLRISYFYFVMRKESYITLNDDRFTDEIVGIVQHTLNMFRADD